MHSSLTGATLGKGLMAPADPTETAGSKKSKKPAMVLKDASTRLVILEALPTLPQLRGIVNYVDELKVRITATHDSMMPHIFGAAVAISTTSSLVRSIPPATTG